MGARPRLAAAPTAHLAAPDALPNLGVASVADNLHGGHGLRMSSWAGFKTLRMESLPLVGVQSEQHPS